MCNHCDIDYEEEEEECHCDCEFKEYPLVDPIGGPFKFGCLKCEHDEVRP